MNHVTIRWNKFLAESRAIDKEVTPPSDPTDSAFMAEVRAAITEFTEVVAGTQNLDHADPNNPDPEGDFFGAEGYVDSDDVGLQTVELPPEQARKLMRIKKIMARKKS